MITKLQRICSQQIKNNYIWCIMIISGFVCGGVIAAVCAFSMPELDRKELALYFSDFFNNINQTGSDAFEIFKISVSGNIKIYIFVTLLSMMVIGSPFVAFLSVVLGFGTCFTIMFMFKSYGARTLLFYLVGMIPHQIILIPCYFITLIVSMHFSTSLLGGKNDFKNKLSPYLLKMGVLFCVSVLSSLLQAYIEPVFIRLISNLFL